MRTFPSSDEIQVFADQLPTDLTDAQTEFAATHYVGSQKMLAAQAKELRKYNKNFIVLNYGLATKHTGYGTKWITKDNKWGNDWKTLQVHPNLREMFYHTYDGMVPIYRLLPNDIREYIANLDKPYWQEYWVKRVIKEAHACDADGIFADSCHPPTGIPASLSDSPLGSPPYRDYIPGLEKWFDYVYPKLKEVGLYLIPNVGRLTTGWDPTTGYYEDVDGIFVEGFGYRGNLVDWNMQAVRTLRALRNGKIYIAQQSVALGALDYRMWFLCNFLLLKTKTSYVNLCPDHTQLSWLPEYNLELGPPTVAVPLLYEHSTGIYTRRYERGIVLVNPGSAARGIDVEKLAALLDCKGLCQVSFSGGGPIRKDGTMQDEDTQYKPCGETVEMPGRTGAILVRECRR